jgi:sec-independent protein translocase protein TatB
MFDIGFTELLLVALLGLIVLGPQRLPVVARQVGRYVARARATWNQMRRELEREIESTGVSEARDELKQTGAEIRARVEESRRQMQEARRSLDRPVLPEAPGEAPSSEAPAPEPAADGDAAAPGHDRDPR